MKTKHKLKLFAFSILVFFSSTLCHGRVSKSQDMLTFYPWVKTLDSYRNLHGMLPRSWSELSEEKACADFIVNLSAQIPDFINRHRFIPQNVDIEVKPNSRILAMGTESLRLAPQDPESVPKRMILLQIEAPKEELTILIIPESTLISIFENSGYKLSDFTGLNGNWQSELKLANFRQSGNENSSDKKRGEIIRKTLPNYPEEALNGISDSPKGFFWNLVGAAIFVLMAVIWRIMTAKRRDRANR